MADGDEVKSCSFLPMELDISWVEENELFPMPLCENSRLSMSSIDMDFKTLVHRLENTSTPFVPRPIMSKSPVMMLHTTQDSGYDEMSIVSSSADSSSILSCDPNSSDFGFIPISAPRNHRERRSIDSDALPDDVCLDSELETDSAYDETSSVSSLNSKTSVDFSTSPSASCDSQTMDIVFQALDLNSSSGYSSMDSSRYCSQQNLEVDIDDTAVMLSESESSRESQVSVVEMVCVKLEKALPMFSKVIGDRLIGRKIGLGQVDIVCELHARNMSTPISIIYSYLTAADLTRVSCVSRAWRESVMDDAQARHKRQQFLRHQNVLKCIEKENRRVKSKTDRCLVKRKEKAALLEIQHEGSDTGIPAATDNVKYNQFVEEASKLTNEESLRKCPQCQHPARVHTVQERAQCSNTTCSNDFCLKCLGKYHGSKDCSIVLTICSGKHKKARTEAKIGSKKSKRNLQRL